MLIMVGMSAIMSCKKKVRMMPDDVSNKESGDTKTTMLTVTMMSEILVISPCFPKASGREMLVWQCPGYQNTFWLVKTRFSRGIKCLVNIFCKEV